MSSISAIPSNNLYLPQQAGIRQDMQALQQAVNSGSLTAAQQAFSTFQQDLLTVSQGLSSQQSSQTNLQNDVNAVGKALSSGDVAGAQKALSSLQQDLHQIRHRPHHHHKIQGTQNDQNTQNAVSLLNGSTTSGSTDTNSIANLIAQYSNVLAENQAAYTGADVGTTVNVTA